MSWKLTFDDPIELPDGRNLITLRDADEYVAALPKAKRESPEWQTATEMLMAAAEKRGLLLFAYISMLKAIHAGNLDDPSRQR